MSKLLGWGLVGLGLYGAYRYISTGTALMDLNIMMERLSYVKQAGFWANLLTQKFKIDIEINNPNNRTVEFQKFMADILHNGKKIASINFSKKLPLKANDKTVLSGVEFVVSNFALGREVWDILTKGDKANLSFKIDGRLYANGYPYPVQEELIF